MPALVNPLLTPLDTKVELEADAKNLLKRAGVYGVIPTPLEALMDNEKIKFHSGLPEQESFLKTLPEKGKNIFLNAVQKIRGISDLRSRAIYIPKDKNNTRERFALAHEIAHTNIEHHNIGVSLTDTNEELSLNVKEEFEREANYFGAELLFQVDHFARMARDYTASIEAPLVLAIDHETSYHSTIWKFIEVQDERVCVAQFYPVNKMQPCEGFKLYKSIGSDSFRMKFSELEIPRNLDYMDEWSQAFKCEKIISGTQHFVCNGSLYFFEWSAWSNTYTLFVMLRHRSAFHKIGRVVKKINNFPAIISSY